LGSGLGAVPARLTNAYSGIGLDVATVGRDRHGALDFPTSCIMVETEQSRLGAWSQHDTRDRIRQIRETDGNRLAEVLRSVGLNGDHQREAEPLGQRFRQPICRHRCDAHLTTPRPIVGIKRVGRDDELYAFQLGIVRDHRFLESDRGCRSRADRLQRAGSDMGQEDLAGTARQIIVSSCHGFPGLPHQGVVIAFRPIAAHCGTTIYVDKEPPGWAWAEAKEARAVGGGAKSLLGPVYGDDDPFQWSISGRPGAPRAGCQLRGIHVADDRCARYWRDAGRAERELRPSPSKSS